LVPDSHITHCTIFKMHLTPAARHLWSFVADFGDIAVILPAYLAAAVVLALHKRHLDAIVWGLALLACAGIAALLKIEIGAFRITLFGHGIRAASFPSGHASLSFVFYGGLAMLIWYGSTSWFGRIAAVMLLAAETLVAIAVFALGWHPLIDVLSGLALGALCVAPLAPIAMNRRRPRREIVAVLAAAVLLVSAMHGARFDDRAFDGISMKPVFLPRG
jgi:membrane-associated phospholipid phosphatase